MIAQLWRRVGQRIKQARYQRSVHLKNMRLEEVLEGCSNLQLDLSCWQKDFRAGGLSDTFVFASLVRACSPRCYFEIGMGFGRSATLAALNTPPDAKINTLGIDYLENPRIGWIFREHPLAGKINAIRGDSKTFRFDPWFGKVDFVFVDGAHDLKSVANDTVIAFKMVAPGGWIVWHDLSMAHPGVAKALQSSGREHEIFAISGTDYACYKNGRRSNSAV
jgi:predicted O-methyltransferase YrrM